MLFWVAVIHFHCMSIPEFTYPLQLLIDIWVNNFLFYEEKTLL